MKPGFRQHVLETMLLEGVDQFVDFIDEAGQAKADEQERLNNLRFIAFMLQTRMVSADKLRHCVQQALWRKGFGVSMDLRAGERPADESSRIALHYALRHGRVSREIFRELDPPVPRAYQSTPIELAVGPDLADRLVDWLSTWNILPMTDPGQRA